ncbi:oxidoreductase [Bryobacterales bacterium F-183]|nr:oxidoreductase [Bryobacterales bacterium F-183]
MHPVPMHDVTLAGFAATAVAAPGVSFALLGLLWLLGLKLSEKFVARLTCFTYVVSAIGLLYVAKGLYDLPGHDGVLQLGDWFKVGEYSFDLALHFDSISLPLLGMTAILTGLIAAFSETYMHREPGYYRFFLLLHSFGFGAMTAFSAGHLDLLVVGWELVGLSSVLLIAFFYQRSGPAACGVRVFGIYRAADIGLLAGVFLIHHYRHSASLLSIGQHALTADQATAAGLLLLLGAMGKAAQAPFSGWLPRAMEGPTPSSAIFYGAISVHMGAYLLLRARPLLDDSFLALGAVTFIGVFTAIHGVIAGRAASDTKTSLAYAAVTQLGLIFAEIGLGWTNLALLHIVGHSMIRTLQFLRAPSMLHEHHHMRAAAGGQVDLAGTSIESLMPVWLRQHLYWYALDRGHLDRFLQAAFVRPIFAVSRALLSFDARLLHQGPHIALPANPKAEEADA